jgi:hypothetical protein
MQARNPLRRTTDRLETGCTVLLVLALLALWPWAGRQAAETAYRDVVRANAAERAQHHRIPATVAGPGVAAGHRSSGIAAVPARWTAPDGTTRTGTVYTGSDRRPGDTVAVWVDDRGRLAGPPSHRSPGAGAAAAVVLTGCAIAAGLAGVRRLVRRQFDHRRLRAWQAEWAAVEPDWSRRR